MHDDPVDEPVRWWRPLLLVVLVVLAAVVAFLTGVPSIGEIRTWVEALGWAGPMSYAVLYAALSLTPTPASVLSLGAGALFGIGVGVPVVLVGAIGGATAGFGLARWLGRGTVEGLAGERLSRLDGLLRRRGMLAMIGIRIAPVLPFAVLNMACGLTGVRTRDYVIGSAVGMAPGAAAFVAIGAFGGDPGSTPFLVAVGGLVLLLAGGAMLAGRRRAEMRNAALQGARMP